MYNKNDFSVINKSAIYALYYYSDYVFNLSLLKMNISISVRLCSLKIELCIDNILNDVSRKFQRNYKEINLRYKYLKGNTIWNYSVGTATYTDTLKWNQNQKIYHIWQRIDFFRRHLHQWSVSMHKMIHQHPGVPILLVSRYSILYLIKQFILIYVIFNKNKICLKNSSNENLAI